MQWLALILLIPYIYILLRIYFSLREIKPYNPKTQSDIFVSVIVACRNEEKRLPSLLSGLAAQDYDHSFFEVIIIDDNSVDTTIAIASGFTGIRNLKVMRNKGVGKKKAIKTGIEACKGELLITTDADCVPAGSWLKTMAAFYSENDPDMIIGPVEIRGSGGFFQRFQELEFLSLQGITAGTAMIGNPILCNGANMAFTKEAYLKNNDRLHEEKVSGDDIFLLHSLKKESDNKIMLIESSDALVKTSPCDTWSSFLKQRARWISKAGSYSDGYTILVAIVTFVTILIQPFLLVAGIFDPVFFLVFPGALIMKSIPDYLILRNTTLRYGRKKLMWWFIPSQIFYTYYILRVVIKAVYSGNRWD